MLDSSRKPSVADIPGQSGAGMLRDHMGRNHGAWLSIADFIVRENFRAVFAVTAAGGAAPGKRSAGAAPAAAGTRAFGGIACPALSQTLPDGNHGENLNPAPSQVPA